MSERINRSDADRIAGTINESLRDGLHLVVQCRNGHTAVDLFDAGGCVSELHIGTLRETYTYLQGMRRALLITGAGRVEEARQLRDTLSVIREKDESWRLYIDGAMTEIKETN